ncbi:geranylgeranylglycerol-phosphate geranylgeranyltransferase [Dinghuibacter silviterrae]|uniref:4-hydroxybenzoate polyprenyltransferase n=1 Tax=Dinghuibacter silviterrae TaxID=1539049 RepID=A0A4R8DWI8_9BACT|nr:geranylgeranylglycerol-phosphate geranylgeranyltransferase [Dinghuibacter silviterrae]TDX01787.1 4-hydroxybenzoate polyprenyltransferase [Dinghuibacter silviterrae]
MQTLKAFFRLIRWPNLVIVVLTQFLFYYCVMRPAYTGSGWYPSLGWGRLGLLSFAFMAMAAAGYIINDYFDLNIDLVNKPDRLVVDKYISRRWAIWWHGFLSLIGIVISTYLGFVLKFYLLGLLNLAAVVLLFLYSVSLKRQLLSGNIVVSVLTAWAIGVLLAIGVNDDLLHHLGILPGADPAKPGVNYARFARIGVLYCSFSFIISMIREVIKDMEDTEGDARYGCRTLPIAWGFTTAKVFTGTWIVVLLGALAIVVIYVLQFHMWLSAAYCFFAIIVPLLSVFRGLIRATSSRDFHRLSSLVKVIMLTGILSLLFFKYYA